MPLPAPLSPLRCNNPDCTFAEGGRCARLAEFPEPLIDCVDLARATTTAEAPQATLTAPWSGRALVPAEVERILWNAPARLVAVVGPRNAGKTTLLTSFFLQLANGQRGAFPYRFASSLTLHSLRDLAKKAADWNGAASDNIVDRTVIADELRPRIFLHLGLRPEKAEDDRHIDLMLTDLPGEWFTAWSGHANDINQQRLGFIQRCDAFILLADAGALMAEGGGAIDSETSLLIRRIVDATRDLTPRPPLALVFSQFDRVIQDIVPPATQHERMQPGAWGRLGQRSRRTWIAFGQAQQAGLPCDAFAVSAFPQRLDEGQPVGVLEPFIYAMQHADNRQPGAPLELPIPKEARGFATMRRWREPA